MEFQRAIVIVVMRIDELSARVQRVRSKSCSLQVARSAGISVPELFDIFFSGDA